MTTQNPLMEESTRNKIWNRTKNKLLALYDPPLVARTIFYSGKLGCRHITDLFTRTLTLWKSAPVCPYHCVDFPLLCEPITSFFCCFSQSESLPDCELKRLSHFAIPFRSLPYVSLNMVNIFIAEKSISLHVP